MVSSLRFGIGLGEFPFSLAFGFGICGADSDERELTEMDRDNYEPGIYGAGFNHIIPVLGCLSCYLG